MNVNCLGPGVSLDTSSWSFCGHCPMIYRFPETHFTVVTRLWRTAMIWWELRVEPEVTDKPGCSEGTGWCEPVRGCCLLRRERERERAGGSETVSCSAPGALGPHCVSPCLCQQLRSARSEKHDKTRNRAAWCSGQWTDELRRWIHYNLDEVSNSQTYETLKSHEELMSWGSMLFTC